MLSYKKFFIYPETVGATFSILTMIVPKHLIDLLAMSALTSVTYSLNSLTIS